MSFPLSYVNFINLSAVLDWHVGLIILLFELLDVTVSSLLTISSHALLACGTLFQLLAFQLNFDLQKSTQCQSLSSVFLLPVLFLASLLNEVFLSCAFTICNNLCLSDFIALYWVKKKPKRTDVCILLTDLFIFTFFFHNSGFLSICHFKCSASTS